MADISRMIRQFSAYQTMQGFAVNTVRRRRWTLERFSATIAPRTLGEATRADVEAFIAPVPAASSRQALLSDLRVFYEFAVERELVPLDPVGKMKAPKVPKRRPRPVSADDVVAAMAYADDRTQLMVMLAALAGLRVSEIGKLRIADINYDRGEIDVRDGKGGTDRTVPLNPELGRALRRWPGRDGYVFGMTSTHVSRCIRELFVEMGIEHRPHDLRAAFATEAAVQSNGNAVTVQKLLGHASMATSQRYLGWSPDAVAVVASLFTRPDGGEAA